MSIKTYFDIFVGQGKRKSTDNSSTSSQLSSLDLQNIVDKLKLQRHRDSTRKNYYNIWKVFCKFLIRLDYHPDNWADRLTLFVGHLINQKRQSATVKSYISAIKSILKDDDIEINHNQFLLSSLTRACKLQNDQICTRLPIQKGMLSLIIEQIIYYYSVNQNQPYLSLLYTTLFSTMYFGLLRISEVTSGLGSHPVLAKDVHVGANKNKFLLVLRTSKTHWKNMKPQIIKISAKKLAKKNQCINSNTQEIQSPTLPCPYQLLRDYSAIRGGFCSEQEPFFVLPDQTPLNQNHVMICLKRAIKNAGL